MIKGKSPGGELAGFRGKGYLEEEAGCQLSPTAKSDTPYPQGSARFSERPLLVLEVAEARVDSAFPWLLQLEDREATVGCFYQGPGPPCNTNSARASSAFYKCVRPPPRLRERSGAGRKGTAQGRGGKWASRLQVPRSPCSCTSHVHHRPAAYLRKNSEL